MIGTAIRSVYMLYRVQPETGNTLAQPEIYDAVPFLFYIIVVPVKVGRIIPELPFAIPAGVISEEVP
jgi:hypothetical protein